MVLWPTTLRVLCNFKRALLRVPNLAKSLLYQCDISSTLFAVVVSVCVSLLTCTEKHLAQDGFFYKLSNVHFFKYIF